MSRNFTLEELIPEPLTFTDSDGTVYDVRPELDLGTTDYAKIMRLQKQLPILLKQIDPKGQNLAPIAHIQQCVNEFIELLIPKLPPERIEAIKLQTKTKFIQWWGEQQRTKNQGEEKTGRGKKSIGKRSLPVSSASTV